MTLNALERGVHLGPRLIASGLPSDSEAGRDKPGISRYLCTGVADAGEPRGSSDRLALSVFTFTLS
jgi:hypothetical protein